MFLSVACSVAKQIGILFDRVKCSCLYYLDQSECVWLRVFIHVWLEVSILRWLWTSAGRTFCILKSFHRYICQVGQFLTLNITPCVCAVWICGNSLWFVVQKFPGNGQDFWAVCCINTFSIFGNKSKSKELMVCVSKLQFPWDHPDISITFFKMHNV